MRLIVLFLINFNFFLCFSQNKSSDYCVDNLRKDTLIGKKVKIYQGRMEVGTIDFELYGIKDSSLINGLKSKRPYLEKKLLLETGAIGEIIYVSNRPLRIWEEDGSGSVHEKFYIIKIEDEYFAVACQWIIDVSEPDNSDFNKKWNNLYKEYPSDCIIKSDYRWIDLRSSYFACDLKNKGIDTLLYSRFIVEAYSRRNYGTLVMWYENGQGFIKSFHEEGIEFPVRESENYPFDWQVLLKNYTSNSEEFKGIIGNFYARAMFEVQFFLPDKSYVGNGYYDNSTESTKHFNLNKSNEETFFYYIESIFSILK